MPPTIQTNNRDDRDRRSRAVGDRRSDLVCRVKYNNTLPDIPFDPKFITYPFGSNRFVQYNPTSLERNYKHDLLTEHDLGITIDLINPDTFAVNANDYLEAADEKLLEDDLNTPSDIKRSRHHNKNVSWLRKTEYISTEFNRFTQSAEKAESRVGFNIRKHLREEDLYRDRDSQIKAIENTFELAKQPITKHYSKPGVVPVDVLPVFPDFQLWKHPFAQLIFDSDPAQKAHSGPAEIEEMSQAMIRGMVDESGDQFVAYFLPSEETLTKRKRDVEDGVDYTIGEEYDYVLAREYNWNVKNKASKGYEETYFFVLRHDGVYYNELETRVRLSKRRKIGGGGGPVSKSRLVVSHRDTNVAEVAAEDLRKTALEVVEEEQEYTGAGEDVEESGQQSGGESDEGGSNADIAKGHSSSSGGEGSGADSEGRSSDGESDAEDVQKKDEEEIFGSSSGSDSDDA